MYVNSRKNDENMCVKSMDFIIMILEFLRVRERAINSNLDKVINSRLKRMEDRSLCNIKEGMVSIDDESFMSYSVFSNEENTILMLKIDIFKVRNCSFPEPKFEQ
jgi:hypothetical protein